jgi:hypothetical protein
MKSIIAANPATTAFQTVLFTCATLIVIAMVVIAMVRPRNHRRRRQSAAQRRRAIVRCRLRQQRWCVAEILHPREEALRGGCEAKMALAAESAALAAKAHVRGLTGVKHRR